MAAAAGGCCDVDSVHCCDDRDRADAPVRDRNHPAPPRHLQAQPPPRGRHRFCGGNVAAGDDADAAGASGVADGRRNLANALPLVRESSADARVDDCGAGQAGETSRRARLLRHDGGGVGAGNRGRDRRRLGGPGRRCDRGSLRDSVDAVAGYCAMGKPAAGNRGHQGDLARRRDGAAADCAAYVALLREVCDGGRQHAPAGQFSGRPEARAGASDVTNQHRALPAIDRRRARLRLDRNA